MYEINRSLDDHRDNLKGVIHIGSHRGQELEFYVKNKILPIIWVEANPSFLSNLKNRINSEDDQIIIECVDNENSEKDLFISSNDGASSSLLDFGNHSEKHPSIVYTDSIKVKTKRMSDIIKEYNIDIEKFNFLTIDVQGKELDVIKSFDENIRNFNYIYTEVYEDYGYKNCSLISEIDDYLSKFNFYRQITDICSWQHWGNAFYIKK
jgi:FkbM family methyltransferase